MGQTFTEKILGQASGKAGLRAGEVVTIEPDVILSHDNTAGISKLFAELPHRRVRYPERLAITLDHAAPPPTPTHARNQQIVRDFVKQHGIKNFFEIGRGICHQVLCEELIVTSGMTIAGADSHTPHFGWLGAFGVGVGRSEIAALWATGELWLRVPETLRVTLYGSLNEWVTAKDFSLYLIGQLSAEGANYKAVEFDGEGMVNMTAESRMVLPNMMAEMGAKNAYIAPDQVTWDWLNQQMIRQGKSIHEREEHLQRIQAHALYADEDATYEAHHTFNLAEIVPSVACPHMVDQWKAITDLQQQAVDVGFIGTCTNGRLEDLAVAAQVLRGKRLRKRLIIVPSSSQVMEDAARLGYVADLVQAGATFGVPGCGPCMGNHMGVLAPREVCISSANRNFQGRMGEKDAFIYLASPAVVAASALTGYITHPSEVMN